MARTLGRLITVAGAVVLGVALPGFRRYRYQPDRAPARASPTGKP